MNGTILVAAIASGACAMAGRPAEAVILMVLFLLAAGLLRIEGRLEEVGERIDEVEAWFAGRSPAMDAGLQASPSDA